MIRNVLLVFVRKAHLQHIREQSQAILMCSDRKTFVSNRKTFVKLHLQSY